MRKEEQPHEFINALNISQMLTKSDSFSMCLAYKDHSGK